MFLYFIFVCIVNLILFFLFNVFDMLISNDVFVDRLMFFVLCYKIEI